MVYVVKNVHLVKYAERRLADKLVLMNERKVTVYLKTQYFVTIDPSQGNSPVDGGPVLVCSAKGYAGAFVVVNENAPIFRSSLGVVDG